MAKGGRVRKRKVEYLKGYKMQGKHEKNAIVRLQGILKKQPNNKSVKERLDDILKNGLKYTRNRKPLTPGSKVNERKKLKLDITKNKNWHKDKPRAVPDWVEVLKEFKETLKPTIRIKKRRGRKYTRVSQGS